MTAWWFTVHGGEKIASRRTKNKHMEISTVKSHWRNSSVLMRKARYSPVLHTMRCAINQRRWNRKRSEVRPSHVRASGSLPGPLVTNTQCLGTFIPLDILVLSSQILARPQLGDLQHLLQEQATPLRLSKRIWATAVAFQCRCSLLLPAWKDGAKKKIHQQTAAQSRIFLH